MCCFLSAASAVEVVEEEEAKRLGSSSKGAEASQQETPTSELRSNVAEEKNLRELARKNPQPISATPPLPTKTFFQVIGGKKLRLRWVYHSNFLRQYVLFCDNGNVSP